MTSTADTPAGARGAIDLTGLSGTAATPSAGRPAAPGSAPRALPEGLLVEATDATFNETLTRHIGVPGILVLWSSQHLQTLDYLDLVATTAATYDGRIVVVGVDLGTQTGLGQAMIPLIQQAFGAPHIPATFGLLQGQPVPLFPGVAPADQVRAAMDQLLEAAVRSGITGRVQLTPTGDDEEAELPPLHQAAFDAIESGDLEGAEAAYRQALAENPKDTDAELGLAQVALMKRTADVDLTAARAAAAADPSDIDAALTVADLDVLGGHIEDAFGRLVEMVRSTAGEERDRVRTHLLSLFAVVGNHDERVKKGRTALMNALF
jgi:putative thioredoxin